MAVGKINGIGLTGSLSTFFDGTSIPMVYNDSSAGETYVDVAGDTYAELPSQTRTTAGAMPQVPSAFISGHVDAGTGTYQLWNHTDSASIRTVTTTSTSEAALNLNTIGPDTGAASDEITLRVKNSGAGNSVTLDFGGFVVNSLSNSGPSSTGLLNFSSQNSSNSSMFGVRNFYFVPLKRKSTATFSGELGVFANGFFTTVAPTSTVVETFDETDSGTPIQVTLPFLCPFENGSLKSLLNVLTLLDSTSFAYAINYDIEVRIT